MEPIQLFLSPADGAGAQTLDAGLDPSALASVDTADVAQVDRDLRRPQRFCDMGDPNLIDEQGWAVVIPDNDRGDHLLNLVRPLVEKRAEDMHAHVGEIAIFRVLPGMTAVEASEWYRCHFLGNSEIGEYPPGYIMILGDFHEVSVDTQRVLSQDSHVGRLAFDDDRDYRGYVDKLLRWESVARQGYARALFFTARDGTPASALADSQLVQPFLGDVRARQGTHRFPANDVVEFGEDDPVSAGNQLIATAASEQPSILFSISHGLGAPRTGWAGRGDEQRALQGALCLGGGRYIDGASLRETPFLPGGIWLLFASFGAGTPDVSGYSRWLLNLQSQGQFPGDLTPIMESLSDRGQPFVANLPKAVLANPDGPLAVIGLADLAWSYSFQDRLRSFHDLIRYSIKGCTAGFALKRLLDTQHQFIAQQYMERRAEAISYDRVSMGPSVDASPGSQQLHSARRSGGPYGH